MRAPDEGDEPATQGPVVSVARGGSMDQLDSWKSFGPTNQGDDPGDDIGGFGVEMDRDVVRSALRRGRDARVSAATTAYGLFLIGFMFGAMGLAALMRALSEHVAPGVSRWMPWLLAVAGAAGVLRGCLAAGPVHVAADVARWLMPTPIRRWLIVRSRVLMTSTLAALSGAVIGCVVAVVSHPGGVLWGRFAMGAGLGAVAGSGLTVLAAVAQVRCWATPLARCALVVVALCCGAGCVGMRAGWSASVSAQTSGVVCGGVLSLGLIVIAAGVMGMPRWADRVHRRDAASAGALVSAVAGSVVMLDAGVFGVRRDARRLARRGRALSRPSHASVYVDVSVRDLRGCLRRWPEAAGALTGVVPAVMTGQLFGDAAGVVALTLAAWCAASRAGDGLATWLGSSSLWRSIPQRPALMTACFTPAPALAAIVVGGLGAAALGLSPWFVAACTLAVVAGQVRRAHRPDMQLGTMIETGIGEVPTGIVRRLVHGPDVIVLVIAVGFRSWPLAAGLAMAAIALSLARGVAAE